MTKFNLGDIISSLSSIPNSHSRDTMVYKILDEYVKAFISNSNLSSSENAKVELGDLGTLNFPFQEFGAINSLDLFGLDELIIFSYYLVNRRKYKKVADIGANIGLHSVIMSLCGWNVLAVEPDPFHMNILKNNLNLNNLIQNVDTEEAAVSGVSGELEFVRVVGNTTSSHLAGAKQPYGELVKFPVKVIAIKDMMKIFDFIKMDVEGVENEIIISTDNNDWKNTDMILEIGSDENAKVVFDHLKKIGVNCFSQKINWERVNIVEEMPFSYRDGSLFISLSSSMNWK